MRTFKHPSVILPLLTTIIGLYLVFFSKWASGQDDSRVSFWYHNLLAGLIIAAISVAVLVIAIILRTKALRRTP